MLKARRRLCVAVLLSLFWACGCDRDVVNDSRWLEDGAAAFWPLGPGVYRLEVTASGDGVSVEWVGAECQGLTEVKSLSTTCELAQAGQVVVKNPTSFGTGPATSVTVKITRIGRAKR